MALCNRLDLQLYMLFLLQIISGGPELFIVALLWIVVCQMRLMNLHSVWLSNCRLFCKQRNPLFLRYFHQIVKRQLYIPSSGTSLPSLFYRSGYSPVSKSSRPGIFAFSSGLVKKAGLLLGIFVVLSSFHSLSAANITSVQSGTWSNTSTWQGGAIPGAGDNVTIAHSVTIDTEVACANITINNSLTISGTNTLTVNGNWTNSGTFSANNSTVVFSGASSTISGSSATAFYNITINKGIDRSTILEVNSSGLIS